MENLIMTMIRGWLGGIVMLLFATGPGAVQAQTDLTYGGDLVTTRAFMADLAYLYKARGKGNISIDLLTSTDAIKRAATGEVDLGGTSRAVRLDDRQERRVAVYPIVWDSLAVLVNRANPILNISLQQLQQVYAGQITNWSQLGGEDQAIALYVHSDPNEGVDYTLSELILGDPTIPLARTRDFPTTKAIEEAVETEPWAMAVSTYSSARKLKLKIISVEGRSPGVQSVQTGDYVLYVPLYLAMREDGRNRRQVRDFLRFATSTEAKRVLRRNGVVPYTDGLALASKQLERAQMLERLGSDQ
jgi:phosphate transport system substrate-binding protein